MRKTGAVILASLGLILAVAVPVILAVNSNFDHGKTQSFLLGMMPGISIIMLARKLSKSVGLPKPMPNQIPPGYQFCDQCSKTVLQTEGEMRQLFQTMSISKEAFVCNACNRYRTKKALIILVLFLGFVGLLVFVFLCVVFFTGGFQTSMRKIPHV